MNEILIRTVLILLVVAVALFGIYEAAYLVGSVLAAAAQPPVLPFAG